MNLRLIKNTVFIVCLVVLCFQFTSSFKELTELIETNSPYIETSSNSGSQILYASRVPVGGDESQREYSVNEQWVKENPNNIKEIYVRTDTLQIYTYKLIQTILLLFGIFMCLVFMAINNHDFSLIKLSEEK